MTGEGWFLCEPASAAALAGRRQKEAVEYPADVEPVDRGAFVCGGGVPPSAPPRRPHRPPSAPSLTHPRSCRERRLDASCRRPFPSLRLALSPTEVVVVAPPCASPAIASAGGGAPPPRSTALADLVRRVALPPAPPPCLAIAPGLAWHLTLTLTLLCDDGAAADAVLAAAAAAWADVRLPVLALDADADAVADGAGGGMGGDSDSDGDGGGGGRDVAVATDTGETAPPSWGATPPPVVHGVTFARLGNVTVVDPTAAEEAAADGAVWTVLVGSDGGVGVEGGGGGRGGADWAAVMDAALARVATYAGKEKADGGGAPTAS